MAKSIKFLTFFVSVVGLIVDSSGLNCHVCHARKGDANFADCENAIDDQGIDPHCTGANTVCFVETSTTWWGLPFLPTEVHRDCGTPDKCLLSAGMFFNFFRMFSYGHHCCTKDTCNSWLYWTPWTI